MPKPNHIDILIQCPGSHGVIPDHVHEQATALHDLGLKVLVLCCPAYMRSRNAAYPAIPCMVEGATTNSTNAFSRKMGKALQTVRNQLLFALEVYKNRPALVLSASHVDSQSPVWVWPHLLMVLFRKTIYAMNLHFANRDHHLGPKWWQTLGGHLAYKPFRIAVAHKRLPPPNPLPKFIRTIEVPIGPEKTVQIRENPKKIRQKWKIPRGKKVFLAFGHIRNHKNLDLVIRALLENPQAALVILGRVSNHRDRPLKYYQMLADDLGLSKRVHISDEFVPDEKRQSYFEAADFIVSTYSAGFHSQTATLPTAASARRHVLASSGNSPMRDLVEHFGLGVFVEPDSSEAVADGMATLLQGELPEANWEGFEAHATWETNVMRLLEAAADLTNGRPTPERQFAGLEDEAVPLPKLLSARALLPAKPQKISKPKKPAAPKARPLARKKPAKRKESAAPEPAEPVAVQENPATPEPQADNAQSIFPGFESVIESPAPAPAKVNGVNGHTKPSKKTEVAEEPKPRRVRKSRSRVADLEAPIERESIGAVAV
jgi:glycosyltransferase involved in cell wall biosynthesis